MLTFMDRRLYRILGGIVVVAVLMLSRGVIDSLDIHFYYTADFVTDFFSNLSADQARRYLQQEVLDLVFLLLYSGAFFLLLKRFFGTWKWLAVAGGLFDFIETFSVILCLEGLVSPEQLGWLGVVTALKWISVVVILLLLIRRATRR